GLAAGPVPRGNSWPTDRWACSSGQPPSRPDTPLYRCAGRKLRPELRHAGRKSPRPQVSWTTRYVNGNVLPPLNLFFASATNETSVFFRVGWGRRFDGGLHASATLTGGPFGHAPARCDHATASAGARNRWIFGPLFERHGRGEDQ